MPEIRPVCDLHKADDGGFGCLAVSCNVGESLIHSHIHLIDVFQGDVFLLERFFHKVGYPLHGVQIGDKVPAVPPGERFHFQHQYGYIVELLCMPHKGVDCMFGTRQQILRMAGGAPAERNQPKSLCVMYAGNPLSELSIISFWE